MSYMGAAEDMYSMAQHASPNVIGQSEFACPQLKSLSIVVVSMSSAPVFSAAFTIGGLPQLGSVLKVTISRVCFTK